MQLIELAKLLNASLQGENTQFAVISHDTRELKPGELFVALKGEQFDGHHFLHAACERKAAGAIVSSEVVIPIPTIRVEDTRLALGKIAAHHRSQFNLPVVAVTGSCGKTTIKTMLSSILSEMGPTLSPLKSFNNDVGVPMTLLQLTEDHHYAVIEMGANHPNEIEYLSSLAKQTVGIISNIAPAHLEGFGSVEGVAETKSAIYRGLPANGVAIINADDAFAAHFHSLVQGKAILTFGLRSKADFTATDINLDNESKPTFKLHYPDGQFEVSLPVIGMHNVINALAASAAAYSVGASKDAIIAGLRSMIPVSKRLITYKGLKGSCIIDDTYNANPLSVRAALELLAHRKGKKIFVFGDMGELGPQGKLFHEEVGQKARELGIDQLYACGNLSKLTVAAFGDNGLHFQTQAHLIEALKDSLDPGAVVLVKGSRSARMENIVEAIIQES